MPTDNAERQRQFRARQKRQQELFGPPPGVTAQERAFWQAFPAREGDMRPSPAQLKKLGGAFAEL